MSFSRHMMKKAAFSILPAVLYASLQSASDVEITSFLREGTS